MITSSDYMSVNRKQLIVHISNWNYHFNYSLNEVICNLKYLQGKWRHANSAKISEIPDNVTKHLHFD